MTLAAAEDALDAAIAAASVGTPPRAADLPALLRAMASGDVAWLRDDVPEVLLRAAGEIERLRALTGGAGEGELWARWRRWEITTEQRDTALRSEGR